MAPNTRNRRTPTVSPYFSKKKEDDDKVKKEETLDKKTLVKKEEGNKDEKLLQEDKGVPDFLDKDLRVLFVGINPGLTSSARGHHYAAPTNHFWPCLSESGLVDRKVTFKDDVDLPTLYRIGFTNLTARTTRRQSDLSLSEQRLGIPILNEKFKTLRPRVACFVGKGIYEIYSKQKCKEMGLQIESHAIPWLTGDGKTLMFVMPSTSGIVSAYQKPDKINFFQELNKVVQQQEEKYPKPTL